MLGESVGLLSGDGVGLPVVGVSVGRDDGCKDVGVVLSTGSTGDGVGDEAVIVWEVGFAVIGVSVIGTGIVSTGESVGEEVTTASVGAGVLTGRIGSSGAGSLLVSVSVSITSFSVSVFVKV